MEKEKTEKTLEKDFMIGGDVGETKEERSRLTEGIIVGAVGSKV